MLWLMFTESIRNDLRFFQKIGCKWAKSESLLLMDTSESSYAIFASSASTLFTTAITPFARCLRCNAALQPAAKEAVIERLEPLTKIYYEEFRRCPDCEQVYWSGSHFEKLQARIEEIRSRLASATTG